MGFETLLGNERLKDNLRRSLKNNHISHFYLICGPAGSGKKTCPTSGRRHHVQRQRPPLRCLYPLPEGNGKQPPRLYHH